MSVKALHSALEDSQAVRKDRHAVHDVDCRPMALQGKAELKRHNSRVPNLHWLHLGFV